MKKLLLFLLIIPICMSCSEQLDINSYKDQHAELCQQYESFNAHAPRFFLFGMGNRDKFIYKEHQLISIDNDSVVLQAEDVINDSIMPADYCVLLETPRDTIRIYEDEEGIWLIKDNTKQSLSSKQCTLKLPDFHQFRYGQVLRVLHHELLFNIMDSRVYPNILVYKAPFYRDAFMAALCLEKTGNTQLLNDWLCSEDSIYDMQNGEAELDNLGEMLYMLSFVRKDSNQTLRRQLIKEIEQQTIQKDGLQYLKGHTDGADNAEYQTQILIMALQKNDMEDHFTSAPDDEAGDYLDLCWFTQGSNHHRSIARWYKDFRFHYQDSPFPYLQWARAHFYNNNKAPFNNQHYPLSWEKRGGSAHFEDMRIISEKAVEERICYPHAWTAAEMFLKLYEER